jgi:hypothetical protein
LRKYVLPLLGLYLDFVWIDAIVVLVNWQFPGLAATVLGQPASWSVLMVLSLSLLGLARVANISMGQWLLSYARSEQPAGQRQWPNILLGTVGFVVGIIQLPLAVEPGDGVPFLFMVEDTPLKMAAIALYGALYGWAGVMLLRFMPGAKLYSALMFASGLPLVAINHLFSRDAMVARLMAQAVSHGRSLTPERAEFVLSVAPVFNLLFVGIMLVILLLCRERPTASVDRPLEGSPSGRA